jgi:murein DD-endopeptidase MepM/ murein hydrolase activator NlpD
MRRAIVLSFLAAGILAAQPFQVIDLDTGAAETVRLAGRSVTVKLESVKVTTDPVSEAVRLAVANVEIDGTAAAVECANYRLPITVGAVQIDCPITKDYYRNSNTDAWGLERAARLRLWPAGSPWMTPGAIRYPVKQRWFATHTQMANEPTYVDSGESPLRKKVYYHYGLDIGGAEGLAEVIAATDGLIVSLAGKTLDDHKKDTPVDPRYDVLYLLDERGWYYRYSHLHSFDPELQLGDRVKQGQRVGLLGKEGGSGGWSHLHWEIRSRQPSGKWGTQEGYAFLWEAYKNESKPGVIAVARPHHVAHTGEPVILDGSRSWSDGGIRSYDWQFTDGSKEGGMRVRRVYSQPGTYQEILKVTAADGQISYDFATVNVFAPNDTQKLPPTIHPVFHPTTGIRPGQPVTFKVRSFRTTVGEETWNFGDGSPKVTTKSDGNAVQLAKDGYAITTHSFSKPGDYLVRVERTNAHGHTAIGHVWVRVEPGR